MKKSEVLALLLDLGPDSHEDAVKELYEKLRAPTVPRPVLAGVAQEVFDLKDVSGLRAVTAFERDALCQLILAKRTDVFDFGALVFPRKDAAGRDDGSYTYPDPKETLAALTLAGAEKWEELEAMLPSLIPDPQFTGGKAVVLTVKNLCPRAPAGSATKAAPKKSPKTQVTQTESALEAAAETPPTDNKKPKKLKQEEVVPQTAPEPQKTGETTVTDIADQVVLAFAQRVLPGFDLAFRNIGGAFRGVSMLLATALQRQEALAQRQAVIAAYLDEGAELPELPSIDPDIASSLKAALDALTAVSSQEDEGEEAPAPTPAPAPNKKAPAPTPATDAGKAPEPKKAPKQAAQATGGPAYTEDDLGALEPAQIDLSRVEYNAPDVPQLHNYSVGSLVKILEAYGEAAGTPIRGAMVRRIIALNERRLAAES